jgi:signal transduction histidine kinase
VVIAFLYWIVKLYTKRKLSKQKMEFENLRAVSNERSRIALDMHDDLGAGLTSIRLLSEVANQKTDKEDPAKIEIEKIVKSAENLSQNLRGIIWTMKTQFDKLEDFIIYIRTYAVEFFDDSSIKFQFNNPVIIPEIKMSGELRRNLFLCIKEALNNIVKHSRATEAELSLDIVNKVLFIEIKDNGVGIDSDQINKFGNGLKSMKERLIKCGSELKIEVNNGTTLKFEITVKE